jgi:hypothetical protein
VTNRPLLVILSFVVASLLAQNAPPLPKSVGKEACTRCHQYERRTITGTPHDDAGSCEGCHGEGEKHLKSGGDSSTMFSYRRATSEEVRARCGRCHQNPSMEKHAQGDVSCVACHSSHHYVQKKYLLKPSDTDTKPV